jgi:hypothetical protein
MDPVDPADHKREGERGREKREIETKGDRGSRNLIALHGTGNRDHMVGESACSIPVATQDQ